MDIAKIEEKLDLTVAGATEISMEFGGIKFQQVAELFEMAKMMAISQTAIPKHLRGNPGRCLAVCIQALEWRMSPFAVANKSYEVNDRIAYEAQLIVGVVNARAPLKERLRYTFDGEGPEMRCTVSGLFKGEAAPLEYISPILKDVTKNSPLWKSDPQQQLAYYSARAWARRHCPETILGIYSDDELRDTQQGPEFARDVTPSSALKERLTKGKKGQQGFSEAHVEKHLPSPTEKPIPPAEIISETPEPVTVEAEVITPAFEQAEMAELPLEPIDREEPSRDVAIRQEQEDWYNDQKAALEKITRVRDITPLTDMVEPQLFPDQEKEWADLCTARSKKIMAGAKTKK